jgi:hypothetical protein
MYLWLTDYINYNINLSGKPYNAISTAFFVNMIFAPDGRKLQSEKPAI